MQEIDHFALLITAGLIYIITLKAVHGRGRREGAKI